jgi:acetyl-CoA C-acetyltransferase
MRVERPADAWLAEGVRSPFGKFGGALHHASLIDLGAQVVEAALDRAGWPSDQLDELDVGIGMIEAGFMVPARLIAMKAGLGETLPSLTIDRACCSGAATVGAAARALASGADSVMCLGVETLSRTPFLLHEARWGRRLGGPYIEDLLLMQSPLTGTSIARYVGEVALEHGVTRSDQDEWALRSHQRYFTALEAGVFDDEIVPVQIDAGELKSDEHPRRDSSLEALAALPTVRDSPTITAGNAPGLNDGACALIVATEARAAANDVNPIARIVSYLQTAGAPTSSAYLPGLAIIELAGEAGLAVADLDVIEINEAYAATPLVSVRRMADGDPGLEKELLSRTNRNGGAVAIGHPIGASGARLLLTAARELARSEGRWAAVAICGGFGQTDALLLERVDG